MGNRPKNVTVITNGLILLYGVVFIRLMIVFSKTVPNNVTLFTAILFILMILGFFAANQMKEWGRKLVVYLMVVLSIYFGFLIGRFPGSVHVGYIIMNIIAILFYNQKRVKFRFNPDWSAVRKSILVIDDDDGVQKSIQKMLLPKGFSVLTATTGEKGLQVAKVQKPDLILLDVILPGIKGREVCSKLKEDEETKDIPVIFLTAKDSPDDISAEMALGAASHMTKPVSAKILVAEINKLLK